MLVVVIVIVVVVCVCVVSLGVDVRFVSVLMMMEGFLSRLIGLFWWLVCVYFDVLFGGW